MFKKILSLLICVLICVSALSFSAFAQMNPGVKVSATAALVSDLTTGQVLYSKEGEKRMNPVEIANVMVAATVVNHAQDLNATVEIKQDVLDIAGERSIGVLEEGEKYVLLDLLYLLILKNDGGAGAVLADYVGGDQDKFVKLMNDLALQYGMTNSMFSNALGLYDMADENYTDCLDTAKLFKYVLNNQTLKEILGASSHEMAAEGKNLFTINAVCPVLNSQSNYRDDSTVAAVSSQSQKAGHALVKVVQSQSSNLIFVMFDSDEGSNCTQSQELFKWADSLERHICVKHGDVVEEIEVADSYATLKCIAKSDVTYICDSTFDEQKLTVESAVESQAVAPISAGTLMGIIKVRYDGELVATVDMIAGNDVEVSMGEQIQTPPLALRLALLAFVIIVITGVLIVYRKKWIMVTK